jgi:hypothetical protein
MWLPILECAVVIVILYTIFNWAYRNWNKADVVAKADQLEELDDQYGIVQETNKKYTGVEEKRNAIKKFKNQ